jgi:hypothetical protein
MQVKSAHLMTQLAHTIVLCVKILTQIKLLFDECSASCAAACTSNCKWLQPPEVSAAGFIGVQEPAEPVGLVDR